MSGWQDDSPVSTPSAPSPNWQSDPVANPETSQPLGLYKGVTTGLDNAARGLDTILGHNYGPQAEGRKVKDYVPLPGDVVDWIANKAGFASPVEAQTAHKQYIADQAAKGVQPGTLGEIAGDVVSTLPTAFLGPLAGGAATGALLTDKDTPAGVLGDTSLGAAGGKLGDLAFRGLGAAAKPLVRAASNRLEQWTQPLVSNGRQAARYVYSLMGDQTPGDVMQAASQFGSKPITSAEVLGRRGVNALATLGRRGGATGDAAQNQLLERSLGTPDRILGDYAGASGIDPAAAQGNIDAYVGAGKIKAAPLYQKAFSENQNVSSPLIDRILTTPAGRRAFSSARNIMQNDMTLMGVPDKDLLEQAAEAGQDIPWRGGVASGLKLRSLDYVKQGFDDQINTAMRAGNKNEARSLIGLKNKFVSALDDADVTARSGPNSVKAAGGLYAQARASAGDYLSAQEAFEKGQKFILNPSISADQMGTVFSKMSPSEQEAFKGGVAHQLYNRAQSGRLAPRTFGMPVLKGKLSSLLGPEAAEGFSQNMQMEADMARNGARMMPGNGAITSDVMNTANEQDASPALMDMMYAGMHAAHGNKIGAAARLLSAAKRAGAFGATAGMPEGVRNEAGRLLLMNPNDLAQHLSSLDISAQPAIVQNVGGFVSRARPAASLAGSIAAPALLSNGSETVQ